MVCILLKYGYRNIQTKEENMYETGNLNQKPTNNNIKMDLREIRCGSME
jgi:hypothetical protein